jgi:hypothetical protein
MSLDPRINLDRFSDCEAGLPIRAGLFGVLAHFQSLGHSLTDIEARQFLEMMITTCMRMPTTVDMAAMTIGKVVRGEVPDGPPSTFQVFTD